MVRAVHTCQGEPAKRTRPSCSSLCSEIEAYDWDIPERSPSWSVRLRVKITVAEKPGPEIGEWL